MNKLVIASTALLSLTALQPVFADPARPQSVMNQTSVYETTLKFFLHPSRLEWTEVAPTRSGEYPSSDGELEPFASLLQLHNRELRALGLKLSAEPSFETFQGETSWMNSANQDCTSPSPPLRSATPSVGTVRSATSYNR
ncbi:MAG: hypothetical protein ACREV9_16760 [Burkholderiales bacterium]